MDENLKYNTLDNGNTDVQNKENEKDESLALSENVIESDSKRRRKVHLRLRK